MMGSYGWKATSLTDPVCPGSLYRSLASSASQMCTIRSEDPDATLVISADQEHRRRFFSNECACPRITRLHRSPSTYGRVSHMRSVLSIELDSSIVPSGDTLSPVMVSVCPLHSSRASSGIFRSQAFTSLSSPPENTLSPSSENSTAVTWYSSVKDTAAPRCLGSHTKIMPSSDPLHARWSPWREGHTELTKEECPTIFLRRLPVSTSHSITVLSAEHDHKCSLSMLYWICRTAALWPLRTA
mmetsp:Transcript_9271/g.17983  ORF Transcript_9271/g.17983 Transcript_9271/m.17983 type:complete len:242 (-) Transcript_9271:295-1020(-)